MNNKSKTKLLTISLLCCGRPETTERCLKSLMPIREAIDSEIQVIDTGCSKETREIIEKYADEVFEYKWCNDFAAARNFELEQANGKMFLYIDDDEWFLDCKYIIEFFKQPDCTNYNIGGYFQRNYLDFDGKEYQDIEVMRMCAVTPETYFKGKVHEYIEPASGNAIFMDARAGHFGYVYVSEEDNRKHAMRNIPLLREMQQEEPDNLRWVYQLAQEYKSLHDYEELYKLCKEGYEKSLVCDDNDYMKYRGNFIAGMSLALGKSEGKDDEVIALYEKEKAKPTVGEIPLAFLCFYAAASLFQKGENEKCKVTCEEYLKMYDQYHDDRARFFMQGGLFADTTFEETKTNMIYCFLMTLGLDEDDYGPLVHYYRKIGWEAKVVRLNRGFMTALLKKASEVGYKKEIRDVLNKFFVTAGFRNLIEGMIEKVYDRLSLEELNKIKEAFRTTEGQKEMDLFMDVRILEKEFAEIQDWDNYGELLAALEQYVELVQQWKKVHDGWLNEDGVDEVVPREVQLANGLEQFLNASDKDITLSLKQIKNMFGIRPAMTNALSELSRLYTTKVKIMSAEQDNPAKFKEMYTLEEQVLAQIAELDAAGKTDEALATYKQLVGILQASYGVDTLHI